ncbi:pentapeptide repeat-containing protein [Pseudomonas sp. C27(2019)]|uniref:pentapeptide repeat-containing protein n=1 Tax=Pseudomonas sp. C27(2019) TaxID=2604941 RepID=UPI001243F7EA|nr:pentapeptide repeat-containing protein [Pseudomonas sp. C27(2019)]QEY59565.1 pentapeptide repeat-containing protein [Pseudomonas sp. C27(2019)]
MSRPRKLEHPLFQLLSEEKVDDFNLQKAQYLDAGVLNLQGADLRGLNLRGLDAAGIDFRDAYFRSCDLRGIDFRAAQLEGASINRAKISGCYFADNLRAEEVLLSLTTGTRMRCQEK